MSYGIIIRAARISDSLKAELGALSSRYKIENEWLRGVKEHLQDIMDDPEGYVDYWNLREEKGITPDKLREFAEDLFHRSDKVLMTPLSERG